MKHNLFSFNGGMVMKKNKFFSLEKEEISKKYGKNHIRNKILVNLVTLIRSLGSVAIVPVYLLGGALAAGIATVGFFATDFIDGFLARKLHVESFFGCLLDALSDKAFGIVCLLLLSTVNPIFLAVIGVELGIFAINYKSLQSGNNVHSSLIGKAKTFLLAGTIVGSFFAYGAPTLKEVLNYVNVTSIHTLLEINPDLLSTLLAIPTIGASLYVAKDYKKKAVSQTEAKEHGAQGEDLSLEVPTEVEQPLTISEIEEQRKELYRQKEEIKKEKVRKSKEEIVHDLFDTDFYLEHRNDDIKKLLYK